MKLSPSSRAARNAAFSARMLGSCQDDVRLGRRALLNCTGHLEQPGRVFGRALGTA